jgi:hypothetical protein
MKSTITITNVDNIDHNNGCLFDPTKVETKTYDTCKDPFIFYNVIKKTCEVKTLEHVSLYDDEIVSDGKRFKILHMITEYNHKL